MDNRRLAISMTPQGRRRVTVRTNLVTGGLRGMEPDHFKFSDVGKAIAKGVAKVTTKDKEKEAAKVAKIDAAYTKLENSALGKIGNKVVGVGLGVAAGLLGLKGAQKIAGNIKANKAEGQPAVLVKSTTPMISPLPMSVPGTPGDAAIEAAAQESQRNEGYLPEALTDIVEKIPLKDRQAITQRAQQIFDSGSNGVLSAAQKKLQELSTNILPKTKSVKEAEALLTAPQHAGIGSDLGGMSTGTLVSIVGAILLVIIMAYYANK